MLHILIPLLLSFICRPFFINVSVSIAKIITNLQSLSKKPIFFFKKMGVTIKNFLFYRANK
ncbi:hypothetical protein SC09_Contig25orf00051 [Bacillus subtilis]|uniref:Uncharacterized protein n=1 Tax=Bacillus subtilis TaxID=1423 RepID=A0A0D1KN80_BACIU|nr:hypothetical protein SC09_Contig25orf00051 [Bacillus subtilis]